MDLQSWNMSNGPKVYIMFFLLFIEAKYEKIMKLAQYAKFFATN